MTSTSELTPIHIPDATEEPLAYQRALLELAEDRDRVEDLATTPAKVRGLCADLREDQIHVEPRNEWSVAQLVGHLFDVDVIYGFRWRLILTEEDPSYHGYNEKLWTPLPRLPFWQTVDAWEGMRAANVALLRALPSEAWQRTGRHGEQGRETVDVMARKVVGHDIGHLNQLERTIHAVLAD